MTRVYVITWRYHDGSASGVVSAHQTEEGAADMVKILDEHGDNMRQFQVVMTAFYGSTYE